jgi:hypothetical protein
MVVVPLLQFCLYQLLYDVVVGMFCRSCDVQVRRRVINNNENIPIIIINVTPPNIPAPPSLSKHHMTYKTYPLRHHTVVSTNRTTEGEQPPSNSKKMWYFV